MAGIFPMKFHTISSTPKKRTTTPPEADTICTPVMIGYYITPASFIGFTAVPRLSMSPVARKRVYIGESPKAMKETEMMMKEETSADDHCSKGYTERNGEREKVRGRRRYQMIDNIKIHGLYAAIKRMAKKREDWKMQDLQ
ncbi:hypothetical protein ANN_10380 [Periplaneta americana]|uniref:Uncharacterized protein n=1 Tax=Periplaneta americana TaxID=6978 RepID=A0ABQ8TP75_PERAM|nr:hypothetical protein ANN_10380 [Periplaneta americana]